MAKNIYFQVQGFVTAAEVAELLPYLPAGEIDPELEDRLHLMDSTVPRDVGSKLVTKMISFSNASEKAYRKQSTRLDNAHDIVAHDTDITYMTLPGIASKIDSTSKKPRGHQFSQSTLYAVHRALMQNEFGFGVDLRSHRTTGEFEIRPKRELQSVNEVRQWLRVYQEKLISSNATKGTEHALANYTKTDPIGKFIEEAHQLIRESRKNRIPTKLGNVGPSPIRLDITRGRGSFKLREGARFSDTSKSIIRFFEIWAGYRSFSRHVPLNSLASLILRAIGMYEDYELDHLVGWLLLQELGVYAPWENRLILNTKLGLPGHHITKEADQMRLENIRAGRSTSTLTDTMQAFRKDWGDMEVFCIDDADAREIDDGISLEEIPGSESTAWVHVHTANPSAFIAKDSPLAKYAAHLTETVYLPERSYPMLPPYITREHFSLAADRPTLTFSAKMTRTGEILEAKITPGIIRKVTFVTPRTMRKVIAPHVQPKPETVITVGGEMPSRGRTGLLQNVTESQKHVLRKLRDLGAARRYQRQKKGAVYVNLPFPQSLVYLGPHQDTPTSLASRGRSCHYDGDPVIQLCAEPFDPNPDPALSGADHLVPDLMMLAGEVAASWCKARNIPVLYRGTQRNSDVDPEAFRQQTVLPTIAKLGYLPLVIGLQYMKLLGRSVVSTTPREHTVIGVDQYAKCTSPLRRFGDLLLHWQVESALRQEAESGKSLVGSRDRSYLAMPLGEIDAMIPQLELRARMISGVKRSSMRHWQAQLMFRAFYFKEAPLPETWELFIFSMGVRSLGGMYSGILKLAATDAEMQPNKLTEEVGVELGDWWEVKIVKVDAYNRSMTTEAVRLIRKARDDGY